MPAASPGRTVQGTRKFSKKAKGWAYSNTGFSAGLAPPILDNCHRRIVVGNPHFDENDYVMQGLRRPMRS